MVALPRTYRKSTDMNSTARLEGASRCWMGVSQVHLFEKTDVASMDWSCYFSFVSTALITGYVSESDLMAYRSYPRDVALHEGFIALLFPCSLPRE